MTPILSIVGKSDSGKTTLLEKVVRELVSRGYRIGTVKHDAHRFEIDHEGKDSWRHKQAGASVSVISSPEKIAVVKDANHDHSLSELRDSVFSNVDLIISEGYKSEGHPKIEVFRPERSPDLLCRSDDNLVAIAGNPTDPPEGVPVFDPNDPKRLCDFIERGFLENTGG
jgi:molybdopterin-guanine dinucleotide biosynthesis protein MobB